MDKSVLSEYTDALKLVEETEALLGRLKRIANEILKDSVKGSNPNFPYEPRTIRIEGIGDRVTTDEIDALRKVLEARRDNAKRLRFDVETWMNTIPIRMQRIIQMKYFSGMTWEEVSRRLGFASPNAARMELERFLKNN